MSSICQLGLWQSMWRLEVGMDRAQLSLSVWKYQNPLDHPNPLIYETITLKFNGFEGIIFWITIQWWIMAGWLWNLCGWVGLGYLWCYLITISSHYDHYPDHLLSFSLDKESSMLILKTNHVNFFSFKGLAKFHGSRLLIQPSNLEWISKCLP